MSAPINDGGPAFPEAGSRGKAVSGEGMSMRDYFAAASVTGIYRVDGGVLSVEEIAAEAYAMADAMLKAREAKP